MSARRVSRLAWMIPAVYVVLETAALLLLGLSPREPLPEDEAGTLALEAVFGLVLLVYTVVGALILARRPRHPVGWLLAAIGFVNAVSSFVLGYARYALVAEPGSLPAGEAFAWLSAWVDSSTIGLLVLLLVLFPDGRLPSRRWRAIVWLTGFLLATELLDLALQPGRLYGFARVENPLGLESAAFLSDIDITPAAFVLIVAAVVGLGLKRRRASAEERQQIKWFLFAASLLAGLLVFSAISEALLALNETANLVAGFLFAALFANLAVSIGIAVLKHRLYDIDLVINRTVVYGALTLTLAAAYLGSVLLLQLL